jgi:serine/threonine protein phosphatase PrpC
MLVQQGLFVLAAVAGIFAFCAWLLGHVLYAVLAVAVLAGAVWLMARRLLVARGAAGAPGDGQGTARFMPRLWWRATGPEPPPRAGEAARQWRQDRDPHPASRGYPPDRQGHHHGHQEGQRLAQDAPPLRVRPRPDAARRPPGKPRHAGGPGLGDLPPEPPVFDRGSTPGQAPWHLPVGSVPSGLAADAVRLGDLEVRAASMVGAAHRCQEPASPRQDAYALGRTTDGRYLVIAVADGVGRSEHSDLGARVAVTAAARELTEMLQAGGPQAADARTLYQKVAGEIAGTARSRRIPEKEACSILITTVIPAEPDRDGWRKVWASWIGDVSLWTSRDDQLCRLTGQDKSGLDRNALSAVLPFNPDQVECDIFELGPAERMAVMTDGLSDSFSSVAGVADYFAEQWAGVPPHPATFLHSLCYDGPGQTDDRTVVVVWCGAGDHGGRPAGREGRQG